MTLPGTVQSAAPGLNGFDTITTITPSTAAKFVQDGYGFCARYVSLGSTQTDLSNQEAVDILNAGLALMIVQRVRSSGWVPSASLGTTYGTNAANNAASIELPKGMNIFCDLEGAAEGTSAQVVIDYCQAWYAAVNSAGYVPGIYVGPQCGLSGTQLYQNLSFGHYWKSADTVPDVATRGYQIVQLQPPDITVNGVGIDKDTTQTDNLGDSVLWLKVDGQPVLPLLS
ncbi:MAG TPA: glycoside hydrolase domain-containing protein [Bacteroidia bacterium]|nr:glycoside hydrolase domain-containing protein [Bacteroidia bacterium]